VTGAEVISELIFELDASVEAASGFEGEMQRLASYARCAFLFSPLQCHPIPAMLGAHKLLLRILYCHEKGPALLFPVVTRQHAHAWHAAE
jgi:hypothetical protein